MRWRGSPRPRRRRTPGRVHLVLTARAENHIRGNPDLDDTIARLRAYGEAGADVLYAPGLTRIEDIRRVVAEVGRPVNVLTVPGAPPVRELAAAGVARISTGGRSRSRRSPRSRRRRASCSKRARTGFWRNPGGLGARAAGVRSDGA